MKRYYGLTKKEWQRGFDAAQAMGINHLSGMVLESGEKVYKYVTPEGKVVEIRVKE